MTKSITQEIEALTPLSPIAFRLEVNIEVAPEFTNYVSSNEVYRLCENIFQQTKAEKDLSGSALLLLNCEKYVLPANYFGVVPKEELEGSLKELYIRKCQIIKTEAYWRKIEVPEIFSSPFKDSDEYKRFVINTLKANAAKEGWEFSFDAKYVKELLGEVTPYFGGYHDNLKRLERDLEGNPVKKKGILLVGGVGLGKTFIMKAFRSNPYQSFIIKSARELARMVKDGDTENFERLTYKLYKGHTRSNFFGQERLALMIDDIGTEDNIIRYGNTDNVIADVILTRYENTEMRNSDKPNLFMTTNLSIEQLETKYGKRVWDRMREMLNIYVLDENLKSQRK